jgi:hypothetical protein
MEKITKQTWEKYDLPENLFELLMEKYNEVKGTTQLDVNSKANVNSQPPTQKEQILPLKEKSENVNQRNYFSILMLILILI